MRPSFRIAPLALALLAAAAIVGFTGCAPDRRAARGVLDTPETHASLGFELIDRDEWIKADNEFNLALSLDPKFSPALSGKAVIKGHVASSTRLSGKDREKAFDEGLDFASDAKSKAKNDDEKRLYYISRMRVYTMAKMPDSWLKKVESDYKDAIDLDPRKVDGDPDFFMARAYAAAFELHKAQDFYGKVQAMRINKRVGAATAEVGVVNKIIQAIPGSFHGKAIAFLPSISKADTAALFVEEMQIRNLFMNLNSQRVDTSFRAPTAAAAMQTEQRMPDVTDISDHPLKTQIDEILELKVRGLEVNPDHKFEPDKTLTRAEFAMMVEDVIVRVTGRTKLPTQFIGEASSPFPDVNPANPFYNSIRTVTSMGMMQPLDQFAGTFGPDKPITGADALLVLKQVNNQLQRFIK